MKHFYVKAACFIAVCMFAISAKSQTTVIPDANFEQELIARGVDTDGVVNGQIATADAEAVTALTIYPERIAGPEAIIFDLTGIEAFVNLERLTVGNTFITALNVSTMPNLRYLDCSANQLTSLDVSSNPLLEELIAQVSTDDAPINDLTDLDLSHNPNIRYIHAEFISRINLKNGNNNPDMEIDVGGQGPIPVVWSVCIEVDNATLAQGGQYPYSDWHVYGFPVTYTENCVNSIQKNDKTISFAYPNPATNVLHIYTASGTVDEVVFYDVSGRLVKQFLNVQQAEVNISDLSAGLYSVDIISEGKNIIQKILKQ